MQNVAIRLTDADHRAIVNGGEAVARAIAEKEGFREIGAMKLINCGAFYRLLVEYEKMGG